MGQDGNIHGWDCFSMFFVSIRSQLFFWYTLSNSRHLNVEEVEEVEECARCTLLFNFVTFSEKSSDRFPAKAKLKEQPDNEY